METIYKYQIPITDHFHLMLPPTATVLAVQIQHEVPCIWVRQRPEAVPVPRAFRLAGTGHPLDESAGRYIGTFQMRDGQLVFHLFEQ